LGYARYWLRVICCYLPKGVIGFALFGLCPLFASRYLALPLLASRYLALPLLASLLLVLRTLFPSNDIYFVLFQNNN